MRLHEYQARELLRGAGVPVPASDVVTTSDEAVAAYKAIGGQVVVKAQVFAGGRGKAGFVKLCSSEGDVKRAAHFMLTNKMVSKQTGPDGIEVKKLDIRGDRAGIRILAGHQDGFNDARLFLVSRCCALLSRFSRGLHLVGQHLV